MANAQVTYATRLDRADGVYGRNPWPARGRAHGAMRDTRRTEDRASVHDRHGRPPGTTLPASAGLPALVNTGCESNIAVTDSHPSRTAAAIDSRAARTDGSSPPSTPITSAKAIPEPTIAGVMRNAYATSRNVCRFDAPVV